MTGQSLDSIPSPANLEIQITMTSPLARFSDWFSSPSISREWLPRPLKWSGEEVADDAVGEEAAPVGEDQVVAGDAGQAVGQDAVEGRACRGG